MFFRSINPSNNRLYKTYECMTTLDMNRTLEKSYNCFMYNQGLGISYLDKKSKKLTALADLLYENKDEFSALITRETGKIPV